MMKSTFPAPLLYQEAIQNPQTSFADPELKNYQVETDPRMGLPRPRSGGFAVTYKLIKPGKQLAVRCFYKSVPDREERYKAVSKFLQEHPSSIFISNTYLIKGILVQGQWYPITYMPWVNGDTLADFLTKNYKNQALVCLLAKEFERVIVELSALGIAHGDLSGANILIKENKMILIDYDGMFVPELSGCQSNELGNTNFQHPRRTGRHYDSQLDRFSALVIYLSLAAISKQPALWTKYGTGEGLLFSRKDFDNPNGSAVLKEMEAVADLKPLVHQFRQICLSDYSSIPSFTDFISNKPFVLTPPTISIETVQQYIPQFPVYRGTAKREILEQEGEMAEVVGQIVDVYDGFVKHGRYTGQPYVFLNFGYYRSRSFYLVIWPEVLDLFEAINKDPHQFTNQWISVTGIISSYDGAPQIVIDSPRQIELLNGRGEADARIKAYQDGPITQFEPQFREEVVEFPVASPMPNPSTTISNKKAKEPNSSDSSSRIDELYRHQPPVPQKLPTGPIIARPNQTGTTRNTGPITPSAKPVVEPHQKNVSKRLNELYSASLSSSTTSTNTSQTVAQSTVPHPPPGALATASSQPPAQSTQPQTILAPRKGLIPKIKSFLRSKHGIETALICFMVLFLGLIGLKVSLSEFSANKKGFQTPEPTATNLAVLVNSPTLDTIKLVSMTNEVKPDEDASIKIETTPGKECEIEYFTPAGYTSSAKGLASTIADDAGVCSWSWKIGSKTTPGKGKVVIKVGDIEEVFPLIIIGD